MVYTFTHNFHKSYNVLLQLPSHLLFEWLTEYAFCCFVIWINFSDSLLSEIKPSRKFLFKFSFKGYKLIMLFVKVHPLTLHDNCWGITFGDWWVDINHGAFGTPHVPWAIILKLSICWWVLLCWVYLEFFWVEIVQNFKRNEMCRLSCILYLVW